MRPLRDTCTARHNGFQFGWWMLLVFLFAGVLLEALHGFKVGFYLDSDREIRRSMWRLAHAHGTVLSLLNIAFAATMMQPGVESLSWRRLARWLMVSTIVIPLGFFGGGLFATRHSPGLPLILVPVGGLCLLVAVGCVAWTVSRPSRERRLKRQSGGN